MAENLSDEVTARPGRKSKASGPVAEFQKTYASLSASLRKADVTQIDQLEQTEDRLHCRFQELVMDRDQTFVVRVLAKQYLAKVDPLHREIRARKRRLRSDERRVGTECVSTVRSRVSQHIKKKK